MPTWLHIILAILITAYFLFRFIKDRYVYEMLFVIWVPSTLLPYVVTDVTINRFIGIGQIVLFILVVYFMFKKRGDHRQKTFSMLAEMAADRMPNGDVAEDESASDSLKADGTNTKE